MTPIMRQMLSASGIIKRGLVAQFEFTAAVGSQILADKSRRGYHGQNGSDAGADTNDATFDGIKATLTTDDYLTAPIPSLDNNYSIIIVAKKSSGITAEKHLAGLGSAGVHGQMYEQNGTFYVKGLGTASVAVKNLYQWNMYGMLKESAYRYAVCNDLISAGAADAQATLANITLGAYYTKAYFWEGEIAYALIYERKLSSAEIRQTYRALKRVMAGRGLSL